MWSPSPLAALALVLTLFSGCAGSDDGGGGDGTSATGTGSAGPRPTGGTSGAPTGPATSRPTGGDGGNGPPVARLAASSPGGPAPFLVNFTVTATDPEGDAVSWSLDFGDESQKATGTASATVSHTYTAQGLYKAVLSVTDGTLGATAELALNVSAAPTQDVSGSYTGGPTECGITTFADLSGITHVAFEVDAETIGRPFTANWTTEAAALWVKASFFDADGALVAQYGGWSTGTPPTPPTPSPGANQQAGTVPEGAVTAALQACGGGRGTVVYHAG